MNRQLMRHGVFTCSLEECGLSGTEAVNLLGVLRHLTTLIALRYILQRGR